MQTKEQQLNSRASGALLPVFSLPGPNGIGTLGEPAFRFLDLLKQGGFSYWQILPTEHTGRSFSPYQCLSAFAKNPLLIDSHGLYERGLISKSQMLARQQNMQAGSVAYRNVARAQEQLLREAFEQNRDSLIQARVFHTHWLKGYALYLALRKHTGRPWWRWPARLRNHEADAVAEAEAHFEQEIAYYQFVQWLYDEQWTQVHLYARNKGIGIVGDVSVYVGLDGADVWEHQELFQLDSDGKPTVTGGAPPDMFNADGQNWEMPVYDWQRMEQDGFQWWIQRMQAALDSADVVRVDHFRGFDRYYAIPRGRHAKEGTWVDGPRIKLFTEMEKQLGPLPIIAENLGTIDGREERLRKQLGYLGIKILQFGLMGYKDQQPAHVAEDLAIYSSTHDNDTLMGFLNSLDDKALAKARRVLRLPAGHTGPVSGDDYSAALYALWQSDARLVFLPVQDMLWQGSQARINVPGTRRGNWRYRVREEELLQVDTQLFAWLNRVYERNAPV